jgi:hypothetical protein
MGPDYRISYDTFDDLSQAFVPVYPLDKDLLVRSLMRDIRSFEIYDCR